MKLWGARESWRNLERIGWELVREIFCEQMKVIQFLIPCYMFLHYGILHLDNALLFLKAFILIPRIAKMFKGCREFRSTFLPACPNMNQLQNQKTKK